MGDLVSFQRPDGATCQGYYVEPAAGANAPGVVVIQEWWGLNDQIKGVANRLTDQGYRVLVPDLYRGQVTVEAAEAQHLMTNLDFGDAATQNIRGAVQHLKASSPKVAVMGYCMGGALTVLAAVYAPETDAAVCWYGVPPPRPPMSARSRFPFWGTSPSEMASLPPPRCKPLKPN